MFTVTLGQHLEMACCNLQVYKVLSFGVSPLLLDDTLGLASVGLLASTMLTSAVGLVSTKAVGTMTWNQDQPVVITAPGIYRAVVFNNCSNVDLSVVVTGSVRIFY